MEKFIFAALMPAAILFMCSATAISQDGKKMTSAYYFAHEDDDVDVVAKITADLRAGKEVFCIWMTNGNKAGDAAVRENETRSVMKLLGVPEDHLIFLGFPDQEAYMRIPEIVNSLSAVLEKIKPDEFMSHAYEGGNIDHDTVALTSAIVTKKLNIPVHYDFPDNNVYNGQTCIWKFLPGSPTPVQYTKMDAQLFDLKSKVIKLYKSQATSLNAYWLTSDKASFKKNGEPYRVAPDYDFTKPPAAEFRYNSTSRGKATIEMFLAAVSDYLSKNPLPLPQK